MKTPVSLLERLRQPADAQAWSRFVQLYLPLICYWGRRAGLQDSDAADLAQEVFALLVQKLPEFVYDRHRSFRSWLRTITLNKWRELCRRRTLPIGAGPLPDEISGPDPAQEVWDGEHAKYLAARSLKLMQADFDRPTWQACWETAVEGRPATDVAQQLGMTVGAVYAAKSRVLRRLRRELQDLL